MSNSFTMTNRAMQTCQYVYEFTNRTNAIEEAGQQLNLATWVGISIESSRQFYI